MDILSSDFEYPTPPDLDDPIVKAKMVMGDKVILAYAWIVAYADSLATTDGYGDEEYQVTVSADELISTGINNLQGGWSYISNGGAFEGVSTDPLFWEKLSDYLQIDIPEDARGTFFSCSC